LTSTDSATTARAPPGPATGRLSQPDAEKGRRDRARRNPSKIATRARKWPRIMNSPWQDWSQYLKLRCKRLPHEHLQRWLRIWRPWHLQTRL